MKTMFTDERGIVTFGESKLPRRACLESRYCSAPSSDSKNSFTYNFATPTLKNRILDQKNHKKYDDLPESIGSRTRVCRLEGGNDNRYTMNSLVT